MLNIDFGKYLAAEVSSEFGSMFSATAVGVLAVNTFDATPAEIGTVVAAGSLPSLVLGLLSGVAADRVRRPRRVLMSCDAAAATVLVSVAIGVWTGLATVWWLAGLSLSAGIIEVVVTPVYFTHLTALVGAGRKVDPDIVTAARARLQVGTYSARLAGRAVAGPVIAVAGMLGLLIDATSYLASLFLLRQIRTPDVGVTAPSTGDSVASTRRSALGELTDGARLLWNTPFLRALSTLLVVMSAASGATSALSAPFLLRTLHLPIAVFSLLFAVSGATGLAGSVLATRLVSRVSSRGLTIGGYTVAAVTMLLLPAAGGGAATAVAALGLAMPILGGALANVGLAGVITTEVPEHLLGRVMSTIQTAVTGAALVGALAGGALGELLTVRTSLLLAAVSASLALVALIPTWREPAPASTPDGTAHAATVVAVGTGGVETGLKG